MEKMRILAIRKFSNDLLLFLLFYVIASVSYFAIINTNVH